MAVTFHCGHNNENRRKSNLQHCVLCFLAESQKDSSSYILTWYPEVCSHNVTKDEKTATVQVCLLYFESVFTGAIFLN